MADDAERFAAGVAWSSICATAGRWIARRDRGLAADEELEFEAWLNADPQHRTAFAAAEKVWTAIDRLRISGPPV